MGEAKRRRAVQRKAYISHLLREAEKWSSPATVEEEQIVSAIKLLPIMRAKRFPAKRLELMGMRPKECFANCLWFAEGEPNRSVRLGWLHDDFGIFVLHALIEEGGQLICITPSVTGAPDEFYFIPDNAIRMVPRGDGYVKFVRNGITVEHGVRANPPSIIARMTIMKDALLAGTDPSDLPRWTADG